jgi:hypothetical protein
MRSIWKNNVTFIMTVLVEVLSGILTRELLVVMFVLFRDKFESARKFKVVRTRHFRGGIGGSRVTPSSVTRLEICLRSLARGKV